MKWRRAGGWTRLRELIVLGWTLGSAGCGQPATPPAGAGDPFRGTKLVVGVVGSPALLRSVGGQRGEWVAKTGSELILRDGSVDPKAVGAEIDVLVFAGDRMGDLIDAGALAVLPESVVAPPPEPPPAESDDPATQPTRAADTFQFTDVAPAFRDLVSKYGPHRYGLPVGGSALVVAFQRAAFTRPEFIAEASKVGLVLEPPRTWDQFDALARFFHGRDLDGDGQPDSGVALAWGRDPEGVGDAIFLARTAAAALHPDQYSFLLDSETTAPWVTSPPFVEALQALVALQAVGPPDAAALDATAARAAFKAGKAALLIDRAETASTWGTGKTPIGVAPLPGSPRVFDPSRSAWETPSALNRPSFLPSGGGWLVGVAARSTHKAAAEAFARYLAEPESTNRLRAERDFPMLAVRTTQLAQGMNNPRSAPGVEPRSWADAVAQTLGADKVVLGLRIPEATGYAADLAQAREAAARGQAVDAALKALADAWSRRTQALHPPRQTWHHRRSLIGPSTAAEPPPR